MPSLTGAFANVFGRPPGAQGSRPACARFEKSCTQSVSPCLWFDGQAEEAVKFYVSVFPNARIIGATHAAHGAQGHVGSGLEMRFCLDGEEFTAINGGPQSRFSPAASFVVRCSSQTEVDRLWSRLGEDGQEGRCGWLTDRYGVSWRLIADVPMATINNADKGAAQAV